MRHELVAFWIILDHSMHTKPSPALPSASMTMTPFCCSQPIDRNENRTLPCSGQYYAGLSNLILPYNIASITWTGICSG